MVLEMTMSGGEERSGDEDEDEAGIDNDDEVETALAGAMAVDHNYSVISPHLPRRHTALQSCNRRRYINSSLDT